MEFAARGKGIKLAAWLIRLNVDRVRFAPEAPLNPALAELLESAGITLETGTDAADRKTEDGMRPSIIVHPSVTR